MLLRIVWPFSTIAAAVSSQEVSMPRIFMIDEADSDEFDNYPSASW